MGSEHSENNHNERIRKSEPAMWIKGDNSTEHGRLILTDTRLLFIRNKKSIFRSYIKTARLNPIAEIELDTINCVAHEKFMFDDSVLAITYLQYETSRFSVIDCREWEKAINYHQMTPHIHDQENAMPDTPLP